MITLEQARREYVCPKCHHKDFLAFSGEIVYCHGCKEQRDLDMKKVQLIKAIKKY